MSDPALHDPLFRAVRQNHPDVDIVILPPAAAPPEAESAPTADHAHQIIRDSRRTIADLLDTVGHPDAPVVDLWSSYSRDGSRRRSTSTAIAGLPNDTAIPMLRVIGDALLAHSWDARPYADGSPRLRAVRGDLALEATAWPHAVEVEITSAPLALSSATASALDAGTQEDWSHDGQRHGSHPHDDKLHDGEEQR